MATKGASYRYGNTRGANHRGEPTKHIGYAWAKDFNKLTLQDHFIGMVEILTLKARKNMMQRLSISQIQLTEKTSKVSKIIVAAPINTILETGRMQSLPKMDMLQHISNPKKADLHIIQRKENQYG